MSKEVLEKILMEEDVISSINNNLPVLLDIIPEIKSMIGFEHKHPHHHLDVWDHTLLALSRAPLDFEIRVVLLLHDIGKPFSYQEGEVRHFRNHPIVSSKMSKNILERLLFSQEEITEICELIKEHDNLITDEDLFDKERVQKKFKIQFCDALAHNPMKLEKRIEYLINMNDKINESEEKESYKNKLNEIKENKQR